MSICGANCKECDFKDKTCKGCIQTDGSPFGKQCFVARYIKIGGMEKYLELKQTLIDEFNSLGIELMGKVDELYPLCGSYVNLEYPLPNGESVKLLDDRSIYLGNQIECEFGGDRCFGLVAGMDFLLVCEYGELGKNPEIVMYKRR